MFVSFVFGKAEKEARGWKEGVLEHSQSREGCAVGVGILQTLTNVCSSSVVVITG